MATRLKVRRSVRFAFAGCLAFAAAIAPMGIATAVPPWTPAGATAKPPVDVAVSTGCNTRPNMTGLTGRKPLPSNPVSSAPDYANDVRMRKEFGFRYDLAWIKSVDQDPTATSVDLGVPLTRAESANMSARGGKSKWYEAVQAAGATSPYFGGIEINQAAGGVMQIDLVSSPRGTAGSDLLKATLIGLLPSNIKPIITYVPYSQKALQAADNTVANDLISGKLDGLHVTSVGQEGKTLTITTSEPAGSAAVATLRHKYTWPFVRVVPCSGVDFQ